MANDIKLQEGHPVDENLRPIKVGNKSTAIETAQHGNGARVNGDLEVTGDIKGNIKDMVLEDVTVDSLSCAGHLTIDAHGDIGLDADGADINFKDDGTTWAKFTSANSQVLLYENAGASTDDYFRIRCEANGLTRIATLDAAGSDADLTIYADGDITLDSETGVFDIKHSGTKFADMYAGMILGCTHVFGSGTGGVFVTIGTAWENLLWDTDKFALVTFVVPPSNKVKISVHLPWVQASGLQVSLGLATDSSATTLNTKYENDVDDAFRGDNFNINYSWVVEGSDHSWSAGETKTLYIMAYASGSIRFYTGGTNTSGYGGVIVEATALPAAIGDGSEP